MTQLFGEEGLVAIAPLINKTDVLVENLRKVGDASRYAGSMQKEYEARAATTANEIQLLKNKLNIAAITIGDALLPAFNKALEPLGKLIERFSEWAKENPDLISTIGKIVAGLLGFNLALFGARFLFGGVISGVGSVVSTGGTLLSFFGNVSTQYKLLKAEGGSVFSSLAKSLGDATGLSKVAKPVKFVAKGIKSGAGAIFDGGKFVLKNAASGVKDIASALKSGASSAASFVTATGGKAVSGIKNFGTALFTKAIPAAWSFTTALLANPMTWIVVGIIALIAAIILLVRNWDTVKAAAAKFYNYVAEKIVSLGAWFSGIPGVISEALGNVWDAITEPFGRAIDTVKGWWDGLKKMFGGGVRTSVDVGGGANPSLSYTAAGRPAHERSRKLALGGHITSPMFAMVGEAGNEWVIPETGSRQRNLSLLFGAAAAHGIPVVEAGADLEPLTTPWQKKKTQRPGKARGAHAKEGGKSERPITITGPVHISVPGVASPEKFVEMMARGLRRYADAHGEASA
jgi:hypothetical protein